MGSDVSYPTRSNTNPSSPSARGTSGEVDHRTVGRTRRRTGHVLHTPGRLGELVGAHDGLVSDFFPDPTVRADELEAEERPQPVWLGAPEDVLPGVVPVELVLGRSDRAVVMLTGLRAFPDGLGMVLSVRTRARTRRLDLHEELFDGPYHHDQDDAWQRDRLKWGFEFADGRRATNVDPWRPWSGPDDLPDHPVLSGGGGGGGDRAVDRDYWLWPLPPAGPLTVVCQWLVLGIQATSQEIDGDQVTAAASRATRIWPEV